MGCQCSIIIDPDDSDANQGVQTLHFRQKGTKTTHFEVCEEKISSLSAIAHNNETVIHRISASEVIHAEKCDNQGEKRTSAYHTISYMEGKRCSQFPNLYGYTMCSYRNSKHRKALEQNKTCDVNIPCRTCSNTLGASQQNLNATVFTDLLALTALDLTAPPSGAVLKNRKNTWIQLAGHPGAFAPAGPQTIWKKRYMKDNNETKAYESLMKDAARSIVPIFHREVEYNGEYFIEMEDLLQHFTDPSIMDIKLGSRTFLESEVKNPVLRKDLYEKMVSVDPDAPTEEERENKAITKLRYMLFREQESSTSNFGFRIEALRMSGETPTTDLKKVKKKDQIEHVLCKFLDGNTDVRKALIKRLEEMQHLFDSSKFFKSHEVIGSSILMMYDKEGKTGAWLIDFSKTTSLEEGRTVTHREPWTLGNHEDGILFGTDNLLKLFTDLRIESKPSNSLPDRKVTTEDTG